MLCIKPMRNTAWRAYQYRGELSQVIILGIDPGYALLGYGVIKAEKQRPTVIDYGVIETNAGTSFPQRLERLYAGTRALIDRFSPEHIAFEELFFYRNNKTALQVAAARGVSILAAQQSGRPLYEYTPMQIKQSVTGDGHADKLQMQTMVKLLLKLSAIPKPDDAADALGTAICHYNALGVMVEEFRIK